MIIRELHNSCSPSQQDNNIGKYEKGGEFIAVLEIRIRNRIRVRMFLGLLDPDPDPLDRGKDPDPAPDPSLFS